MNNLQKLTTENRFDDITANRWRGPHTGAVFTANLTAAATVQPLDSGATYFLSALAGFAITLPAPALGLTYTFVVQTAPTSNGYTITTNGSANIFYGAHSVTATGGGNAISGAHVLTFVANSSVPGDNITLTSDGTNWYVNAASTLKASITNA